MAAYTAYSSSERKKPAKATIFTGVANPPFVGHIKAIRCGRFTRKTKDKATPSSNVLAPPARH
jgi:hypothetical protein